MKPNWRKLRNKSDKAIDYSDIPNMKTFDWSKAGVILPEAKTRVNIRIDTDVYGFFKLQGPKYQTKINAVLRSYMEHELMHPSKRSSKSPV
jgi:uncharacterized protein (DUF4415 family)